MRAAWGPGLVTWVLSKPATCIAIVAQLSTTARSESLSNLIRQVIAKEDGAMDAQRVSRAYLPDLPA